MDLDREWKTMWNMYVAIIPFLIGTLGTIIKGLLHELKDLEITGRVEIVQTTALLSSAIILRRDPETRGNSKERLSVNADVKNTKEVK